MNVKTILNNQTWTELAQINNRYPNFINFIKKKYGDYESRYPELKFRDLFESLIINHQTELAFAETLTNKTTNKLADDQLGDIVTTTNTSNRNSNNDSVSSYKGYNVSGDYAKNANTNTGTSNTTGKSQAINYFSYLAGINQNRFSDTWKQINREFLKLVVTIVEFSI